MGLKYAFIFTFMLGVIPFQWISPRFSTRVLSASPEDVAIIDDISYGPEPRHKLDIFLSRDDDRRSPKPIVLFIHGGGWSGGDKSEYRSPAMDLARRGYASVAVNYRLNSANRKNPNRHPAQVEDVARAVEFLAANAAKWNLDPNRIVTLGHSAGGHLSLLYAYGYDKAHRVKAVVAFSAPTDFTAPEWFNPPSRLLDVLLPRFLGSRPGKNPKGAWISASPLRWARENPVPTVLIHGRLDELVPVQQAVRLDAELARLGVDHLLLIEENETHSLKTFDDKAVAAFLAAHCPP